MTGPGSIDACASAGFGAWLEARDLCLVVSLPFADRLLVIRPGPGGAVELRAHGLRRPMGMAVSVSGRQLWVAGAYSCWRFEHGEGGWLPRAQHVYGDLDVHDLALDPRAAAEPDPSRAVLLAATAYSCVARLDPRASFEPVHRPAFVSALVAEDRCHLNGLAVDEQGLRLISVFAPSDQREGWRQRRADGQLIDVRSGEPVAEGLCLPHSPRIHAGVTWVLESGRSSVVRLDRNGGLDRRARLPGLTRGLCFVDDHPIVGLSRPRHAPELDSLDGPSGAPCCGLRVLSPDGAEVVHRLDLPAGLDEIYEIVALRGAREPFAGPATEAALRPVILA